MLKKFGKFYLYTLGGFLVLAAVIKGLGLGGTTESAFKDYMKKENLEEMVKMSKSNPNLMIDGQSAEDIISNIKAKKEADKKAELERIAKEKAEAELEFAKSNGFNSYEEYIKAEKLNKEKEEKLKAKLLAEAKSKGFDTYEGYYEKFKPQLDFKIAIEKNDYKTAKLILDNGMRATIDGGDAKAIYQLKLKEYFYKLCQNGEFENANKLIKDKCFYNNLTDDGINVVGYIKENQLKYYSNLLNSLIDNKNYKLADEKLSLIEDKKLKSEFETKINKQKRKEWNQLSDIDFFDVINYKYSDNENLLLKSYVNSSVGFSKYDFKIKFSSYYNEPFGRNVIFEKQKYKLKNVEYGIVDNNINEMYKVSFNIVNFTNIKELIDSIAKSINEFPSIFNYEKASWYESYTAEVNHTEYYVSRNFETKEITVSVRNLILERKNNQIVANYEKKYKDLNDLMYTKVRGLKYIGYRRCVCEEDKNDKNYAYCECKAYDKGEEVGDGKVIYYYDFRTNKITNGDGKFVSY